MELTCEVIVSLYVLIALCRGLMQAGAEKYDNALYAFIVLILVAGMYACLYFGGLYD